MANTARHHSSASHLPASHAAHMSGVPQVHLAWAWQGAGSTKRYVIACYYDVASSTLPRVTALTWLRGTIEVHDEMEEMRAEYDASKLVPKVTMRELFTNAALRSPLIISLMVMIAQQLSGINAVSIRD
jgi:hypothetical protein